MSPIPKAPKIYHITHTDNLPRIVDKVLWSDAERIRKDLECKVVGMGEIKRRRLEELVVDCHVDTKVGDYVPFYFCPRSIMLYILHMGNSPGLTYHGGQRPIVHLQADLNVVLKWLGEKERRWAFSRGNAGAYYTDFYNDEALLRKLDWDAISQNDWRDPDVKESKQSEFLIEKSFPWKLVEVIGVIDGQVAQRVSEILEEADHKPEVVVQPGWYY